MSAPCGRRRPTLAMLAVALAAHGAVATARAAIIATGATVSVRVQEFDGDQPTSVSSDRRVLFLDAATLPIAASTELVSADLTGTVLALGRGLSQIADPTRLDQPDPEEFALEAVAFSGGATSHDVLSESEESRTILFADSGGFAGSQEIDFAGRSSVDIESRTFIRGVILVWSTSGTVELDGTVGELQTAIVRDGDSDPLFETAVRVAGDSDGSILLTTDGPVRADPVTIDDLIADGLETASSDALRALEVDGVWRLYRVSPQEHAYTYAVAADESFVLRARFSARARSTASGTGVVAAWGDTFADLADVLENAIANVNGDAIGAAIVENLAGANLGLISRNDEPLSPAATRPCGALGAIGTGVIGAAAVGMSPLAPRRRRTRQASHRP